jgi:nucleoside-diphosphate-sugar epimerase
VETEALIRAERGNTPVVLLRIAGVYDDRCHSLPLAQQIRRIYERRFSGHFFPGDPSHGQSFLHRDDLVDALSLLVDKRGRLPPETTLLLGEPDTLGYGELQREFGILLHGRAWGTYRVPKLLAKAGIWLLDRLPFGGEPFIKPWMVDIADDHYALDIARARDLLGWEPKRSLRATLPKMTAALKSDPVGWYGENGLTPPSWLKKEPRASFRGEAHAE